MDKRAKLHEILLESEESVLLMNGFDDALIGVGRQQFNPPVAIYDRSKCIEILESQGMTPEEADEFFCFNTENAWVGKQTPLIVVPLDEESDISSVR